MAHDEPVASTTDPRLEAVRVCQDLLPQRQRDLVRLRGEDDYTLDELAAQLLPPDVRTANARRLRIRREGSATAWHLAVQPGWFGQPHQWRGKMR